VPVQQREDWYGEQQQLSPAWTLHKGRKTANFAAWSHQFGWELHPIADTELPVANGALARGTGRGPYGLARCDAR
jgi:hypothetical protein